MRDKLATLLHDEISNLLEKIEEEVESTNS